jgi:muconolactone delta-isomerase
MENRIDEQIKNSDKHNDEKIQYNGEKKYLWRVSKGAFGLFVYIYREWEQLVCLLKGAFGFMILTIDK